MLKTNSFSILKLNIFNFGKQKITQFVIFECKYLFSIIIFYFHKSDYSQDRFHTHAFNAISIKLFGEYNEYILTDEDKDIFHIERRKGIVKYFPRNSFHKIGDSNGCCTILFSGPWKKEWKERINGETLTYNWGRGK